MSVGQMIKYTNATVQVRFSQSILQRVVLLGVRMGSEDQLCWHMNLLFLIRTLSGDHKSI